ncbi:MAG TPA: ATP-dependent zinc metalloprotease FtsH [Gemmatimonadales bacterium]|nr:ATP-dependent zinc metalloprotease FtsH [Gemmatimonadales bacterium]
MKEPARQAWWIPVALILTAAVMLWLSPVLGPQGGRRTVSYGELLALVRADSLAEARISETRIVGVLRPVPPSRIAATVVADRIPGVDPTPLVTELQQHGVAISGDQDRGFGLLGILASWVLPLAILMLIYRSSLRRMGLGASGPLRVGANKARIYDQSTGVKVTFEDVAGVDEAKAELVEVVDFLKHPERYQQLGGHIPRGVLLVGPPGTGKTLLARAVAGESGVPFFSISGSEFMEMFVGVGAARVRDLFAQAKERAPCIVFIDELDAIGKSRATGRGIVFSHEEREQTLGQLLSEMDGFSRADAVIILAATNAPETLDAALIRPGRFDRQVLIDRPDVTGREAILKVHARAVRIAPDVDWKVIASRTPGMVGADLANIVNEGSLLAARRGGDSVTMTDLEEAIDRVLLGLARRSHVMTPAEKERVAFHETGHALVALAVDRTSPVHRVSIIPRSVGALGHTLQLPTEERYLMTEREIRDRLAVMLGGRAAEAIVFLGVVSTGGQDDLQKATELARQMVTRFGMSEHLGPLTWGRPTGLRFLEGALSDEVRNYSEETARSIDAEVREIVEEAEARAMEVLLRQRRALDRVGHELIQHETLSESELMTLVRSAEQPARPATNDAPPGGVAAAGPRAAAPALEESVP